MVSMPLRSRFAHGSRRRRAPSYWIAVTMAVIVIFGIILAVVMWLSAGPNHSSNDPNRVPHHSTIVHRLTETTH